MGTALPALFVVSPSCQTEVRVHDLWRSAIRNLIRAGVGEHIAMQFSGHRTASVFRRYDVIAPRDLAAASASLDAYLANQPVKPKVIPLRKAE